MLRCITCGAHTTVLQLLNGGELCESCSASARIDQCSACERFDHIDNFYVDSQAEALLCYGCWNDYCDAEDALVLDGFTYDADEEDDDA